MYANAGEGLYRSVFTNILRGGGIVWCMLPRKCFDLWTSIDGIIMEAFLISALRLLRKLTSLLHVCILTCFSNIRQECNIVQTMYMYRYPLDARQHVRKIDEAR